MKRRNIIIAIYLAVWVLSVLVFWLCISGSDAMAYSLLFLWILIPLTTLVLSFIIGINCYWGRLQWITSIVFGIMYMLAEYATFSTSNMLAFTKFNMPHFEMIFIGAIISLLGILIGNLARYIKSRRRQ